MKKVLGIILDILIILAVIFSLILIISSINHQPNFLGLTFVKVQSGSMSASGINIGDVRLILKSNNYNIGDIIAFYHGKYIYFHEIVDIAADGSYITQGSSNLIQDIGSTSIQDIIGKQIVNINFAFLFSSWFKIIIISIVYTLIMWYLILVFINNIKLIKEEKTVKLKLNKKKSTKLFSLFLLFIPLLIIPAKNAFAAPNNYIGFQQNIAFKSSYNPEPSFDEGTIITVDKDGNIIIDDEIVKGEVNTEGDNKLYNNGDVSIKVQVNENGDLVLTEFTTSNTSWAAFFGSDLYLPTSLNIDGVTYPITGIDKPLDIDLSNAWFGLVNNTVNIPSGYTYICDEAFASITNRATFNVPNTITSIGNSAFMPARNITQTINYSGTSAEWNNIDKDNKFENGAGNLTINYNR